MSVNLTPQPRLQFVDVNGNPYSGAKLFTYLSGTTTKQATYTNNLQTVAHANPIILDSSGRPSSEVWLVSGVKYTFVLAPSTDTDPPTSPILTDDNIEGVNDVSSSVIFDQWIAGPTPTYVSAYKFTLAGDQTATFHAGRRVKFTLSASSVYGTIVSSVFTTLTTIVIHLDSGALDATLSAVSYGVLSYTSPSIPKRDIIKPVNTNGDFLVWQAGTTFTSPATLDPLADMWNYGVNGAAKHTVTLSTDAPTVAQAGRLILYSMKVDCTTVDTAIAAGDYTFIATKIEGYDFIKLAQRAFCLGFWVKGKSQTYCVSFRNGVDRSFVAEYTINTNDTWEYKTIQVLASPSAGTWNYTNGVGLEIDFVLAAGTTFQTTAGAWQTGDYLATSNQVNFTASASNDFFITGVRLFPGSMPTVLDTDDYQETFIKCLRYYETYAGTVCTTQPAFYDQHFNVYKRDTPTITVLSGGISTSTIELITTKSFRFETVAAANMDYNLAISSRL
jgi:hypothetical protein